LRPIHPNLRKLLPSFRPIHPSISSNGSRGDPQQWHLPPQHQLHLSSTSAQPQLAPQLWIHRSSSSHKFRGNLSRVETLLLGREAPPFRGSERPPEKPERPPATREGSERNLAHLSRPVRVHCHRYQLCSSFTPRRP
jgi:hypothetical protein